MRKGSFDRGVSQTLTIPEEDFYHWVGRGGRPFDLLVLGPAVEATVFYLPFLFFLV